MAVVRDPGNSRCLIRDSFEVEKGRRTERGDEGKKSCLRAGGPQGLSSDGMDVDVIDSFCAGCQGGLLQLKEVARDIWQERDSQILGAR